MVNNLLNNGQLKINLIARQEHGYFTSSISMACHSYQSKRHLMDFPGCASVQYPPIFHHNILQGIGFGSWYFGEGFLGSLAHGFDGLMMHCPFIFNIASYFEKLDHHLIDQDSRQAIWVR